MTGLNKQLSTTFIEAMFDSGRSVRDIIALILNGNWVQFVSAADATVIREQLPRHKVQISNKVQNAVSVLLRRQKAGQDYRSDFGRLDMPIPSLNDTITADGKSSVVGAFQQQVVYNAADLVKSVDGLIRQYGVQNVRDMIQIVEICSV